MKNPNTYLIGFVIVVLCGALWIIHKLVSCMFYFKKIKE